MGVFYDDSIIQRENAMPPHWVDMFSGGQPENATVNMIDGDRHKKRKAALMACFSSAAITSYLPLLEKALQDNMKKWVLDGTSKMKWVPALKSLCFEECCRFILGLEPSPELIKSFDDIMAAFAALPVKLPGSTLSAGLASRDKLLDLIRKGLNQNRQFPDQGTSAISYLLQEAARDPTLSDDIICFELLHFMIAGMAPVYTLHVYLLLELSRNDHIKTKVREEISQMPTGEVSLEALSKLSYTDLVIKETQRLHAGNAVPFSWGKLSKDCSHAGFEVPAGWGAVGAFHACSLSSKIYEDPEKFDPSRFQSPRMEHKKHPCAFVPQGLVANVSQTHGCAGYAMTEIMLKLFLVHLLKSYDWELLPKQKLTRNGASVPALPTSGMKVKFFLKKQ
jgi:retinoid hydroxylase